MHEKLFNTEDFAKINIQDYIDDLLPTIFSFSPVPVKIGSRTANVMLQTKTIVPLGLIVNEIATNAVKHGFSNSEEAVFTVDLQEGPENKSYVLTLSNNGPPFPNDIDFNTPKTLGLRLTTALVEQLDGTIELQREPHPVFTIRFPIE